ncbi:hypothetical protein E0Z10_g2988 [Xylaria hypoxylon]|uniref:non-specific serine/threonine protein kinase n=1 Tax=Xylaria hypoxylon TaxID=37992 RepID=A0A4Z0Z0N9_9PEZI|nr:hypothetical protein E0Z10_g2988 [Xylaria hypoxylon]
MANNPVGGPMGWYEQWQAAVWRFKLYRESATIPGMPRDDEYAARRAEWINNVPRQGRRRLRADNIGPMRWNFLSGDAGRAFPNLDGPTPYGGNQRFSDAKIAVQAANRYFSTAPYWQYIKPLGYGGNGVAIKYRFDQGWGRVPFNFVLKIGLRNWISRSLRHEVEMTRKMERAAHSVQMIPRTRVGLARYRRFGFEVPGDGSSDDDDGESSGEESRDDAPDPAAWDKRTRREIQAADPQRVQNRRDLYYTGLELWNWRVQDRTEQIRRHYENPRIWVSPDYEMDRKDFILTEFCENGDLEKLMYRYPPRKFHPRRRNNPPEARAGNPGVSIDMVGKMVGRDLFEEIPPPKRRWAMKRFVHFDIDPKNIFITGIDVNAKDNEHKLVPRLKKDSSYYARHRDTAKFGYFAPEQFGIDWELIQKQDGSIVDEDGPEISEQTIAGNYGSAMNVWQIGITMWQIMTQMRAPVPPQLQRRTGLHADLPVNYCPRILDEELFDIYDLELRLTVARCMAYDPKERPSLRTLLQGAQVGINKSFDRETDDIIKLWVQMYIFDAA